MYSYKKQKEKNEIYEDFDSYTSYAILLNMNLTFSPVKAEVSKYGKLRLPRNIPLWKKKSFRNV